MFKQPKQSKSNKAAKKPVHAVAKRNIISYQTQKRPNFYRQQAKKALKTGDKKKHNLVPNPAQANPVGLSQQTLPDGATVHIYKAREQKTTPVFGAITHLKRARVNFNPATDVPLVHQIATTVAQAAPIVVQESGIQTVGKKFFFNSKQFTAEDYKTHNKVNNIVRIAAPAFLEKAGLFNRSKGPKSLNQKARWAKLVTDRNAILKQQKAKHQEFIASIANSHLQLLQDMGVEDLAQVQSTDDAPIDFSNNLGLKFRILDAVQKATKLEIPSSALAEIKNTRDLTNWMVAKSEQLSSRSHVVSKGALPDNVTFIYTAAVDRKKEPKWVQYKALREKKAIAGTADV